MAQERQALANLARLFHALYQDQVNYVLFGTVGLLVYGAQVETGDLDICPALDQENLKRLGHLLDRLGAWSHPNYNADGSPKDARWLTEPLEVATFDYRFTTPYGELDVVPYPYGPHGKTDRFCYEQLQKQAETRTVFGLPILVAGFNDLVASKLSAQRAKDLRLLPEIERLRRLYL